MISKETFVKAINTIKTYHEVENLLIDTIEKVTEGVQPGGFFTLGYEDILISVLDEAFGIQDEEYPVIDFFIYVLDFGKKWRPESLEVDGVAIDISTPEKLYDYLYDDYIKAHMLGE